MAQEVTTMDAQQQLETHEEKPTQRGDQSQQQQEDDTADMAPTDAKEHLSAITTATAEQTEQQNGAEEDDEEVVVTLDEVLQEDALLTDAANAVLGASSATDCSYPLGYMRQALYACLTCTPESEDASTRAGVCLACSYSCHENHELIELYTKRDFRCDCGNDKFPKENPCKLVNDKAPTNERNVYSQNFTGKYCSCHRPYPDPERTTEEVMLQCVVCEDWLHAEHVFPAEEEAASQQQVPDDFDDFICVACMVKHQFLLAYDMDDDEEEEEAAVAAEDEAKDANCILDKKLQAMDTRDDAEELKKVRPTFWAREWRDALCKCAKCVARFEKEKIAFLLDPEDSLQAYEESARECQATEGSNPEDRAQQAFSSKLSHQQQVEMAIGYSHMKNSLQEYLSAFAAAGKTVRAEDIQSFFEDLREKKRQKTEP